MDNLTNTERIVIRSLEQGITPKIITEHFKISQTDIQNIKRRHNIKTIIPRGRPKGITDKVKRKRRATEKHDNTGKYIIGGNNNDIDDKYELEQDKKVLIKLENLIKNGGNNDYNDIYRLCKSSLDNLDYKITANDVKNYDSNRM
jgi:hypothetical protein